jgi:hypothetical protein
MFRRPSVRYGTTPEPVTPYQKAAQVWDERIGSARVQARNWRLMAFGCLALAAGLSAALVWQSTRGSVVPYVVEVDNLGAAQAVAPASSPSIARPIRRSPGISPASSSMSGRSRPIPSCCARTGCAPMISPRIAARGAERPCPRERSLRAGRRHAGLRRGLERHPCIRVELPRRLVERRYENGQLAATERWTAILTVVIQPPRDAERLRANPLGVYVHAINWSRENAQ